MAKQEARMNSRDLERLANAGMDGASRFDVDAENGENLAPRSMARQHTRRQVQRERRLGGKFGCQAGHLES
jgi:hypothetical protein